MSTKTTTPKTGAATGYSVPTLVARLLSDEIARMANTPGYATLPTSQHDGLGNFYSVGRRENIVHVTCELNYYQVQTARQDLPRLQILRADILTDIERCKLAIEKQPASADAQGMRLLSLELDLANAMDKIERCTSTLDAAMTREWKIDVSSAVEFDIRGEVIDTWAGMDLPLS